VLLILIPDAIAPGLSSKVPGSSHSQIVLTTQSRVSNVAGHPGPPPPAVFTVPCRSVPDSTTSQLPSTFASFRGRRDLIAWGMRTQSRNGVAVIGYEYYAGYMSSWSGFVRRKYSPRVISAHSCLSNGGHAGAPLFSRHPTRSRCFPDFRNALRSALSTAIGHPAGCNSPRAPPRPPDPGTIYSSSFAV
jgi:hypothetical protein